MNKFESKFGMGDLLKESVTGFKGVVVCISHYSTGCIHYSLQSQALTKEGKLVDWENFDESRVTLVRGGKRKVSFKVTPTKVSGPFPNPPQQ